MLYSSQSFKRNMGFAILALLACSSYSTRVYSMFGPDEEAQRVARDAKSRYWLPKVWQVIEGEDVNEVLGIPNPQQDAQQNGDEVEQR